MRSFAAYEFPQLQKSHGERLAAKERKDRKEKNGLKNREETFSFRFFVFLCVLLWLISKL
jgi:hypothetical protein